jgi:hypothetical protein
LQKEQANIKYFFSAKKSEAITAFFEAYGAFRSDISSYINDELTHAKVA